MNNTAQNFQQDYDKPDDILTQCTQLVSFDDAVINAGGAA